MIAIYFLELVGVELCVTRYERTAFLALSDLKERALRHQRGAWQPSITAEIKTSLALPHKAMPSIQL